MAQQYYSMEDAAEKLGVTVEELRRLREDGTLRGFADAGSWKFRAADIDKMAAERAGKGAGKDAGDEDLVLLTEADLGDSGSSADENAATMVGSVPDETEAPSDSDVKLIADETGSGDSDVKLIADAGPSDSDVRLVGGDAPAVGDSDLTLETGKGDSDVRMMTDGAEDSGLSVGDSGLTGPSDSDVRQVGGGPSGDSDVTLADIPTETPSDSDVRLADDSGLSLSGSGSADSDIRMITEEMETTSDSGVQFVEDSEVAGDSALDLDLDSSAGGAADSDVTLAEMPSAPGDSGFGSGSGDSGVSLSSPADSGISLEGAGDEATQQLDVDLGLDEEESGKDIFDDTDFEVAPLADDVEIGSSGEIDVDGEESSSEVTEEVASDVIGVEEDAESGSEVVALDGDEVSGEGPAAAALGKGLLDGYDEEEAGAEGDEDLGDMDQPPVPARAGAGAAAAVAPAPMWATAMMVLSLIALVFSGLFVMELFRNQFTGLEGTPYVSWLLDAMGFGPAGS